VLHNNNQNLADRIRPSSTFNSSSGFGERIMAVAVMYQEGASIDYTPSSAVSAGDVIVQEDLVGIAKEDIAADELGALAITGNYYVKKDETEAFAIGQLIYWDVVDDNVTDDSASGANKLFGKASAAADAADTHGYVLLLQ